MFILLFLYSLIPSFKIYGIRNTLWYIFYLNANEFSPKLDLMVYYKKYKNRYKASVSLTFDRRLAHDMENYFYEEKRNYGRIT